MVATPDFEKVEYDEIPATDTFSGAPRFGHSGDFSMLFSDDQDDQTDYIRGLLFGGTLVLAFFLAWSIVLLVFKCLGQSRVGFLSGGALQKRVKRVLWYRIAFLTAAIVFIAFSFLMYGMGSTHLQDTENTISNANQDVGQVLQECDAVSTSIRSRGQVGDELRAEVNKFLSVPFCSGYPNLEDETGFNFEEKRQDTVRRLDDLDDFIDSDLAEMIDAISDAQKTVNNVEEELDRTEVLWSWLLVMIVFVILATWMLWGMLLSWFGLSSPVFTCLISKVGLPLFVLATVLAYIICSGSMLAVVANADFCSGGEDKTPDVTVVNILNASGFAKDEITYEAVRYYAMQCDAEDPWDFIREFNAELEDARNSTGEFRSALRGVSVARLDLVCDRQFSPLEALLTAGDENLGVLQQLATKSLEILDCKRIAPIYSRTVYKGTCDYSMKGFTWTVVASLIIGFSGMIMLTFRSVLWELMDDEVESQARSSRPEKISGHRIEAEVTSQAAGIKGVPKAENEDETHGETHTEEY